MISSVCWVPKGASKILPVLSEAQLEEFEKFSKTGVLERKGEVDEEDDDCMDVDDADEEDDEVEPARVAARSLNQTRDSGESRDAQKVAVGIEELNMDAYDDENDEIELFGKWARDTYYKSNDMDPYLQNKGDDGDDDEDEIEDMTIKPTDSVIICARNEDYVNHLEVWIYEESGDGDSNMYVHHDVLLPAFPLCTAWLDCNLKDGEKGNFLAVGSVEPEIEIWDLDLLDEVQPFLILGGVSKKKKEKKKSVVYRKDSHRDAVLGLAWNKEVRNVLASASADKSVKIWDVVTGKCVATVTRHADKVQSVAWNRFSPELLLSGSFDKSVVMVDGRSINEVGNKWSVMADVESLAWDPHADHLFVVSQENGVVQGFDIRIGSSGGSNDKPVFTLHAHDKAVSSISYNPSKPSLLATGSTDKTVKLWDLSNNQPSCVAQRKPEAGSIFSIAFSEDNPFLLAIGGHKGELKIWDIASEPGLARTKQGEVPATAAA